MVRALVGLIALALLAGCSTAAGITYTPTVAATPASTPRVATVTVVDAREERDPTYIGAIRGGFGNPLKTLTSAHPVQDEVTSAFTAALRSRGLLGPNGNTAMTVRLTQLSGNQVARREGHTAFTLTLADRAGGPPVYQDQEDVLKVTGSLITFDAGVFASVDDLRGVVALSLSTAIDQALDKPGFAAALR